MRELKEEKAKELSTVLTVVSTILTSKNVLFTMILLIGSFVRGLL